MWIWLANGGSACSSRWAEGTRRARLRTAAVARAPGELLGLAGITVSGPFTTLNLEQRIRRTADFVLRCRVNGVDTVILVEFERKPRTGTAGRRHDPRKISLRMLVSAAGLAQKYGLPVRAVLVVVSDGLPEIRSAHAFGCVCVTLDVLYFRDHPEVADMPSLAELAPLTVPPRERLAAIEAALRTLEIGDRTDRTDQIDTLSSSLRRWAWTWLQFTCWSPEWYDFRSDARTKAASKAASKAALGCSARAGSRSNQGRWPRWSSSTTQR